jgi:hypothetical protein
LRPLVLIPLLFAAAPAFAQEVSLAAVDQPATGAGADNEGGTDDVPTDEDIQSDDGEILVIARRLSGQVDAPQPAIQTLDEEDIQAYGAGSIAELLTALTPQTGSGRGRGGGFPVMLINGRRISNFREMRDLPPEAIRRMEILPEEVALRYGYQPNQRVVNFILKDHFASKTLDVEYEQPTRGGTSDSQLEAGLFRIDKQNRLNVTGKFNNTSILTEGERGVIQQVPAAAGAPDPADYRSLIGEARSYALNGTWSTGSGVGQQATSLTINGAATRNDSRSLNGIQSIAPDGTVDPLTTRTKATTLESGVSYNKPLGKWNLTATADGSYGDTRTRVDQTDATPDTRARTQTYGLTSLITVMGRPVALPAGDATLTVKAGYAYSRSDNESTQSGSIDTSLRRSDVSAGVNLGLPLTSRRDDVLSAVGDLTLNFSGGLNHLSDFGTLKDWSAGLTWSPTEKLGLQASYIVNEAAPSLAQLGNPVLTSLNVPVYDFTRGENALVTVINGGNPNLKRETQRDIKLSANWQLPFLSNSNLIVEYFRNRSSDVTQSFPLLTPEIEAAFPGRVVRDASGRLVSIDRRPVTFSEVKSSRLRWGFNVSGTVGKPQPMGRGGMPGMAGQRPRGGPEAGQRPPGGGRFGGGMRRPGGGGGFRGGPMGGPMGGTGQGRWNLSLVHTIEFTNTVLVAPGGPALDLLGGDALTAGGVARHGIELEGGLFHKGFGLRATGNWSAPVTVGATGAGGSDLRFGSVTKLNLRAFVNFDQKPKLIEDMPFLKGMRLSLKVDNLLDSRQRVTDANGVVPLSYQADYRDPRGRVIGIDLRKMF